MVELSLRLQADKVLFEQAERYAKPISWLPDSSRYPEGMSSCTFFVLKSESAVFAVTAAHAMKTCLEVVKASRAAACLLLDLQVPIADRIIECDEELDIATFVISEDEIEKLKITPLCFEKWVRNVQLFDEAKAQIVGVLDERKKITEKRKFLFEMYGLISMIESFSQNEIMLCYDPAKVDFRSVGVEIPKQGMSLSGCSGGPVLMHIEKKGIYYVIPVGMVFSGPGNEKHEADPDFDIIRAKRLRYLSERGRVIRA